MKVCKTSYYIPMRIYLLWNITSFRKKSLVHILERKIVGFDVRLKNHVNNLATNGRVVFETVDLNKGNGYNVTTGVFTAPAAGLYVFDWTTLTQHGKHAYTSLVVNGKSKSWNHCHDGVSKTFLPCSKMAVESLKQGDRVWIGVFGGQANMYQQYTSFSGFKL